MKHSRKHTIAAAFAATIVVSLSALTSCEGRKMSNMHPVGETVEVPVSELPDTVTPPASPDSL